MANIRRSPRKSSKPWEQSQMSSLPDECLISIFGHLPIRSRCRAARVNKRWNSLMRDKALWRNVQITGGAVKKRRLKTVLLFVETYLSDNLETLVLHHVNTAILQYLHQNCPKLTRLSLKGKDLTATNLAELPPCLTELSVASYEYVRYWYCNLTQSLLNQIEKLEVFCPRITNDMLGHISMLQTLKYLQLVSCDSNLVDNSEGTYTERGFSSLVQQLTELRVLRFQHCSQLTDTAFFQIGNSLSKLEELTLHSCYNVTDVGLRRLKNLASLRILDLGGGSPVTPEGLMEVIESFNTLQELWLFDTENVRLEHIEQIRVKHPKLTVNVKDRWDSVEF